MEENCCTDCGFSFSPYELVFESGSMVFICRDCKLNNQEMMQE